MSIAKVIEISSRSSESFEDAIRKGISRASKTIGQIQSAWVKEQQVEVSDGSVSGYQVNLRVTFTLKD